MRVAFAHAQCMNDVKSLPVGRWQWNGWLTPKGRVIALFALLKFDDEHAVACSCPMPMRTRSPRALQRFVFRSKLSDRRPRRPACRAARSQRLRAPRAHAVRGRCRRRRSNSTLAAIGGPRTLRIAAHAAAPTDADAAARWAAFDLRLGLPRLPPSQAEQWTPQMLSLERLQAFSVKKGCYPGQEIVARTHFLGQAKRGLALFEADAPVDRGGEVRDGERVLGTVVSARWRDWWRLAVLPLEREATMH